MFNWATVIVLLPLEIVSGLLFHITEQITRTISLDRKASSNPQFLNVLTKPLTHRIIEVRKLLLLKSYRKIVYSNS
jgi:sodium-dependent phosphate cotransporter